MYEPERPPNIEPKRDPWLARAIRDAEGCGPSRARLELLGRRIAVAAWIALEGKRECAWWEWMTRWARAEVALATAAMILAVVAGNVTGAWSPDVARSTVVPAASVPAAREWSGIVRVDSLAARAVVAGSTSEQVMNALVGPANDEWLFTEAVAR